ncbi:MAG: glutathione S-transferase family protein [Bradyrhizobiaceae bacterium]|nr:MAG: glutathione S-transferase family protein [Bradyrhizobiaceae bacterium]
MSEIIIHHYPQSPVSEKIRKAMGLKNLRWRSAEQSRFPDRPELFAMTGGYRRLPVLQIGADLYCDTQCIFRELEQRFPSPSLFPNGERGLPFALSRWTDDALFGLAMRASFAPIIATLPPALVEDRTRLYLGPNGDFQREIADMPHTLTQLRAQLGWLEEALSGNQLFLFGGRPGMGDLLAWFIVWFIRGKNEWTDRLLRECPAVQAWAARMDGYGYGQNEPISPEDALAQAYSAQPGSAQGEDGGDPLGLQIGSVIAILPISDTGEKPIKGVLLASSRDTVTIRHSSPECGTVSVHFPRVGYRMASVRT